MQAWRNETQGLTLAVVSVTRQAGAALQAALAAHPPGQLAVRLRMPAEGSIDWSSAALWVLATGTVTLGALWAGYGHWAGLGRDSDTPKKVRLPWVLLLLLVACRLAVQLRLHPSGWPRRSPACGVHCSLTLAACPPACLLFTYSAGRR